MTPKEVAAATGIRPGTVYANIRAGRLRAFDRCGSIYISVADCLEWARLEWKRSRAEMYSPERAEKYITDFEIDGYRGGIDDGQQNQG